MELLRRDLLGEASRFYQKLADDRRGDPRRAVDLAQTLLKLSQIEFDLGATERAIANAEEARALFETLATTDASHDTAPRLAVAESNDWAGYILGRAGRSGPARERLGRSLARTRCSWPRSRLTSTTVSGWPEPSS